MNYLTSATTTDGGFNSKKPVGGKVAQYPHDYNQYILPQLKLVNSINIVFFTETKKVF